jgi:hypothetical protein
MLEDEQGIQAIIELQAIGGVIEPKERATINWANMTDVDKQKTEDAHLIFCGGFDKEED